MTAAAKTITAAAVAAVLLAPGATLVGLATILDRASAIPAAPSCQVSTEDEQANVTPAVITDAYPQVTTRTRGAVPATLTATDGRGRTVTLDHTQLQRAAVIVAVGVSQGVPQRGQLIALIAALTESSLRVLSNTTAHPDSAEQPHDGDGSDHDSLGLFQMRPSTGWGTVADLMNPVWSARAFYGGPDGPNHGSPRGLLDVPGWQELDPGSAAQAVEVSAYPDRYAANEPVAARVLTAVTGAPVDIASCEPATAPLGPANLPAGFAGALIAAAARELGTPYVWGGGSYQGPTGGGFDCSGLVLYAAYQASNGRLRLPHYTGDQIHAGTGIAWADRQPGDLVFFSYPGAAGPHHVAIYLGGERILQAPHTGDVVRYGTLSEFAGQTTTVRRLS